MQGLSQRTSYAVKTLRQKGASFISFVFHYPLFAIKFIRFFITRYIYILILKRPTIIQVCKKYL